MRYISTLSVIAVLVGFILISGCNRTKISGLKPAEGVVMYDNKPLAWATVAFVPESSGTGRQGAAQADGDGKFVLLTLGDPGLLPGKYKVMVHRTIQDTGKNSLKNWKNERASDVSEPRPDPNLKKDPNIKLIPVIPSKYLRANTSGIEVTIPAEGDRNIEIILKD